MHIRSTEGLPVPQDSFKPKLYRQPSLAEGALRPAPYRHHLHAQQVGTNKELYFKYASESSSSASAASAPMTEDSTHSLDKGLLGGRASSMVDLDDTFHDAREDDFDLLDIDREVNLFLRDGVREASKV
ncbi:hypothetical protein EON64_18030, partial [archaeon]